MLILTIKEGHCIHIGDDVVMQVETHRYDNSDFSVGKMKGQVRFGIEEPKSVRVLREELCLDILPALKNGDSHYWTAMPGRKNIPGRINVALVSDTTLTQVHSLFRKPILPFGLLSDRAPQHEQAWVVYASLTSLKTMPAISHLYSSIVFSMAQPASALTWPSWSWLMKMIEHCPHKSHQGD